jgi:hypothetical protein
LKPQSILDVGVGFGKWGHLFREYTDINEAERDPARYRRENWRVRIDGIEGHPAYLTQMHRFLYNDIHVGDAAELMNTLANYDLIFLGDVIEHFEKAAGFQLLRAACARANKAVIVSTPKFETEQEDLCGNELERHRSLWAEEDFKAFEGSQVVTVDDDMVAVITSPDVSPLKLTAPRLPDLNTALRLARTRRALLELVPLDEPFILVDEEQFRPFLQERQTIPFLEKAGVYWGPPPDDATAIRELERLRLEGACHIVFAWPSFWWLEHYTGFARHLRSSYRVTRDDSLLKAFALAQNTR